MVLALALARRTRKETPAAEENVAGAAGRVGAHRALPPATLPPEGGTPRRAAAQSGRTRIVYRNGEKVDAARERDKAKWSNWDGSNMDPDSVARHNRSLRRAGFRDNAHAKGFF